MAAVAFPAQDSAFAPPESNIWVERAPSEPESAREISPGFTHKHYNLHSFEQPQRLLVWREWWSHDIDMLLPPLDELLNKPFNIEGDLYTVGSMELIDYRSGPIDCERSLARISRDRNRGFLFQVFLEGHVHGVSVRSSGRGGQSEAGCVVVRDLGQPIRMRRTAYRMLSFAAPESVVAEVLSEPEMLHGYVIAPHTPAARLITEHVAALSRSIPNLSAEVAESAMRAAVHLIVASFNKQARLSGAGRAAMRAAVLRQARSYIRARLYEPDLAPETVLSALQLSRRTVYRMFENEGGMAAYISRQRLRQAGLDLLRYPDRSVTDVAYGLGFKSLSDFSRAFRRDFLMTPRDYRAMNGAAD